MMKTAYSLLLSISMALSSFSAFADSWKDEGGHGKGHKHDREYKEEYWDGNCKVEREFKKNGDYKEERKCKEPRHGHYQQAPVYVPAPAPVIVEPGVRVHGTVTIGR